MDWKERLNAYRDFYDELHEADLFNNPLYSIRQDIFNFSRKMGGLSPIEEIVYDIFYCYNIPFYPQYPVFNLIVDFCNPENKIILECDGKAYHDREKDKARDLSLLREGYKVFRLTGSQIHRDHEKILQEIRDREDCGYDEYECMDLLDEYFCNTAMGFIESLKSIYFNKNYRTHKIDYFDLKLKSLMINRLVEFKVLPDYKKA